MDVKRLEDLGFTLMCGQVDYKGKNYGTFNHHGALLTDEGDALVAQLEDDLLRGQRAPAARKPRGKTVEVSVPADSVGLNAALDEA